MKALVIPVGNDPLFEIDLPQEISPRLEKFHELVGGYIELIRIPNFVKDHERACAYINEEGKNIGLPVNYRATDFFVPGAGLMWGDVIVGPCILIGADFSSGEDADVPEGVVARARLIAEEAS